MKTYKYRIEGKEYEVTVNSVTDGKACVTVNGVPYEVDMGSDTGRVIAAPLPGRIVDVLVPVGDVVSVGQSVVILEAMKMENEILSEYSGVVSEICVSVGDTVSAGAVIAVIG